MSALNDREGRMNNGKVFMKLWRLKKRQFQLTTKAK